MSPTRFFIQALIFAALIPASAHAAWNDHRQGNPALEFYPNRVIGTATQTTTMVQDARGRLFVGGDTLLVYDGVNWTSQPLPDSYNLAALCFGPDQKLWAGGHNQVGYYSETSHGVFTFTSLIPKLPPEHQHIESTWGCGFVGTRLYFVCQSKILCWDGNQFSVWDFPNTSRLYPVRLGNELWFTHLETGLYRLTETGPKLEFGPRELPKNPAFGLDRDGKGLRILSRDGLCYAGRPQEQLCSDEVIEFLRIRPLSSVQQLPDGNIAIGTFGGLGIMAPDGSLLRSLNQEGGLSGNAICSLFLDWEKQLWIGQATGGLARIDPTGSTSLFQRWGQADRASILRLAQANNTLMAATDAGLFRLETNPGGEARFLSVDSIPAHVEEILAHKKGLLLGRFGGLDFLQEQATQTVLTVPGQNVWQILPATREPDTFFCLVNQTIVKVTQSPDSHWLKQDLVTLADFASGCFLDQQDNLWLNSARSGIWHFDTANRKLTPFLHNTKAGIPAEASQVTGHGQHVYFFTNREGFMAEVGSKKINPIAGFPEVTVLQCITSSDGRRLYVVFERKRTANTTYGLGRLTLDENGAAGGWTELVVPKLQAAGVPSTLLVTIEDGNDALWVGGSEGVVRLKPDELAPIRPPARPWLLATETSTQPASTGPIPAYAFSGHHLLIHAGTDEIDTRPRLLFQIRLDHGQGEWSQPSPRSTFEFTNLVDGPYTFEIRAVNEAGLVSESVAHSFRILPPWYRTPWAYASFAAVIAAVVFGYIRFHERQIRARNQQLESLVEKRTEELVKANAAKDEFLAGISHEIRNPMNGVIGIATVIDSSRFDPTAQQHMVQLRHCATHLSGLLEDILDYSRLQAGAVELNPTPFDLLEMTEAIAAITAAESARYGIPVEIAVSPTLPRRLVGDLARLRQILLNYVVNALKYSGRGTVCLTIWGQQTLPDQVALTFAVSDDGPGISVAEQARLFTRFERGAAAQNQRVAGTGLGLALCKTLGEKMGGRLWVESEPGQGSTFYFSLSLPVATGMAAHAAPEKNQPSPLKHLHALVVDDEEYNRITLASFLQEVGFRVTAVATGDAAIAIAQQQTLNAVFLDMNLPGMSGPEIAAALRAMDNLDPDLPIIATTAYTTAEKRQQCSDAGMSAFLTKPISLDKIHAALSAATSAQRPAPSFHLPGQNLPADALGNLRLLAQRKGIALQVELALFFSELANEESLLTEAIQRREPLIASDAAHRLIGRLAFINATAEAQLARDIETNSMNEFWEQAEASAVRLVHSLPDLRDQMKAATGTSVS